MDLKNMWRRAGRLVHLSRLSIRSYSALRYANRQLFVGGEFDSFGRQLGLRLLIRGQKQGLRYLLNPVSTLRYFEFSFAKTCLDRRFRHCLDVSSPRLFSVYVGRRYNQMRIEMLNPDEADLQESRRLVHALRMDNLSLSSDAVDALSGRRNRYDAIWSISVVEHVSGAYDDTAAVRMMYDALRPGGSLILTVPVDRAFREDFRSIPHYGVQALPDPDRGYFFQRVYDIDAIQARLVDPLRTSLASIRWFGETVRGRFRRYEERWMQNELETTVEDPKELVDGYREFASWEDMPGFGVCGILVRKA